MEEWNQKSVRPIASGSYSQIDQLVQRHTGREISPFCVCYPHHFDHNVRVVIENQLSSATEMYTLALGLVCIHLVPGITKTTYDVGGDNDSTLVHRRNIVPYDEEMEGALGFDGGNGGSTIRVG